MMTTLKPFGIWDKTEAVNTNNAWGFGGWEGIRYTSGSAVLEIGRNSHRHTGTSSHFSAYGLPDDMYPCTQDQVIQYFNSIT